MNVEERVAHAKEYFAQGYNCSQAVLLAYADYYGIDKNTAALLSAPLGGGVGRMREVCGAVTGMALVVGLKYPAANPSDKSARMTNYAAVREVAKTFEEQFGSVVCRELLSLQKGEEPQNSPQGHPLPRRGAHSCAVIVENAARIVGERISKKD